MSQHFSVMKNNPNVAGGCLCSETRGPDTKGPFIVFNSTEMDTIQSPFPVLCYDCACKGYYELINGPDKKTKPKRVAAPDDVPEV